MEKVIQKYETKIYEMEQERNSKNVQAIQN